MPHNSRAVWIGLLVAACLLNWMNGARGQVQPPLPRDTRDAAIFRGALVFANYCVTCHGIHADGNGRAARLYNPRPANLRLSDKNDGYLGLIVKLGGEAMGRSPFMPPWGAELTEEQMRDLVAYVRSLNERNDTPQ